MTNTIKVSDVSVEKSNPKRITSVRITARPSVCEVISEGKKKGLFGFGQKKC